MQNGDKQLKIDESIKVGSWTANFANGEPALRAGFEHYSSQQVGGPAADLPAQYSGYGEAEQEVRAMESGFRKLKREQIDKLKDLKSEYENIRKITTDYVGGKGSKTPSARSSSRISQSVIGAVPVTPVSNFRQSGGGRQAQILELEKKQLESMVENSMKKIEELLHNEMQYKKTIHELKLQPHHVKPTPDHDKDTQQLKAYQRKQKQLLDKIKVMELERQSLISGQQAVKEQLRVSEASLTQIEQHLKRAVHDKKSVEELIRTERDKFMNLQIELKRERREHEIADKDRLAEIKALKRMVELKEGSADKDLRSMVQNLEEQLRVKEDRYSWVLHKLEAQQRSQNKVDHEQQLKMVNQILSRSHSEPSHTFQDTMANLMQRMNQLEHRPVAELQQLDFSDSHEQHLAAISTLQETVREQQRRLQQHASQIFSLSQEKQELQSQLIVWEHKASQWEIESGEQSAEIDRLKRQIKQLKNANQPEQTIKLKSRSEAKINLAPFHEQARELEWQIETLKRQVDRLTMNNEAEQQQNRRLRQEKNQLELTINKTSKEGEFKVEHVKREFLVQIEELKRDRSQLKARIDEMTVQNQQILLKKEDDLKAKSVEISRLRHGVETAAGRTVVVKQEGHGNEHLRVLREEHNAKVNELTGMVHSLTMQNHQLQEASLVNKQLAEDNDRLKQYLRQMRAMDEDCDRLWARKETEYAGIENVLMRMN